MVARSIRDLEQIWTNVDGVRKASDRLIGLGPFGIGLDGLISLLNSNPVTAALGIPIDTIYTWGAGGWLLYQAVQARASAWTVTRILIYVLLDTAAGGAAVIPLVGSLVDVVFQGHAYAARALQKDIETTHWVEASWQDTRAAGTYNIHQAEMRAQRKRRLVFLQD